MPCAHFFDGRKGRWQTCYVQSGSSPRTDPCSNLAVQGAKHSLSSFTLQAERNQNGMTVNDYRNLCQEPESFDFLCNVLEIWQNDTCIGYAIEAAQRIGLTQPQIRELVLTLNDRFDVTSIEAAAQIYREWINKLV